MKLKSEWVSHSTSFSNLITIESDEICDCGIIERHKHCTCCGFLASRGSGEVIGSYRISKSGLKRIK